MKPTILIGMSAIALSASLLLSATLVAEEHGHEGERHTYKLIDLGTFGGPISYGSVFGDGGRLLNNKGVVSSQAEFATPDPNAPKFCFVPDCLLAHASR